MVFRNEAGEEKGQCLSMQFTVLDFKGGSSCSKEIVQYTMLVSFGSPVGLGIVTGKVKKQANGQNGCHLYAAL